MKVKSQSSKVNNYEKISKLLSSIQDKNLALVNESTNTSASFCTESLVKKAVDYVQTQLNILSTKIPDEKIMESLEEWLQSGISLFKENLYDPENIGTATLFDIQFRLEKLQTCEQ